MGRSAIEAKLQSEASEDALRATAQFRIKELESTVQALLSEKAELVASLESNECRQVGTCSICATRSSIHADIDSTPHVSSYSV